MYYIPAFFILTWGTVSHSINIPTLLQTNRNYNSNPNAISAISGDLESANENLNKISNYLNSFYNTLQTIEPTISEELITLAFSDEDEAEDVLVQLEDCISSEDYIKYLNQLLKEFIIKCMNSNPDLVSRELMEEIMNHAIQIGQGCLSNESLNKIKDIYNTLKDFDEESRKPENIDRNPLIFLNKFLFIQDDEDEDSQDKVNQTLSISDLQERVRKEIQPVCKGAIDFKYDLEDANEILSNIITYFF